MYKLRNSLACSLTTFLQYSIPAFTLEHDCLHQLSLGPLLPLPRLKLPLQMALQLHKATPKVPATPPTLQILIQEPLSPRPPPLVPTVQREVLQRHHEPRRETVVVLPMLHALAVPIPAEDVDVQMVHAWHSVHACYDLLFPVTSFAGRWRLRSPL